MDSNDGVENHPPDDCGYHDVFHAPNIVRLSTRLAKDHETLNIGVTNEKRRALFNSLCKLKSLVHKMTERMLLIALAVCYVISVALGKHKKKSPQNITSTRML